jgi:hypothetical protein
MGSAGQYRYSLDKWIQEVKHGCGKVVLLILGKLCPLENLPVFSKEFPKVQSSHLGAGCVPDFPPVGTPVLKKVFSV